MTAIIIIAILVILVLWVISVQRKLVKQEEICKNGLSQIEDERTFPKVLPPSLLTSSKSMGLSS